MKVLLYHFTPFSLAHGGQQIQIERTAGALAGAGVETGFLDWHNPGQKADILHFFGRMPLPLLLQARQKGWKIVIADLLAAQGARGPARRAIETFARRLMELCLPAGPRSALSWRAYREADACVALTSWERDLLEGQFQVPAAKVHVIPNGVEEVFLRQPPAVRGPWLLCVATITPVKRVLETAKAAVAARTPILFAGRPYSEGDPYAREFGAYAKAHPDLLRWDGPVEDRAELAKIYRESRGFVLLSQWESLSLAALEAAACGCPLMLSGLPWAKSVFAGSAMYCPPNASLATTATHLRAYYDSCPSSPPTPPPIPWSEVGTRLRDEVYGPLLSPPKGAKDV